MRYFLFLLCALLLIGCATSKKATPSVERVVEYRDSVHTEYIERTVFVPDTVFVEIPQQGAERETRDSVSKLENDYAWSVARITPDGLLFHSLFTKPQIIPVAFDKPVTTISTGDTHISDKLESNIETKVEYVERELTWWQKTQIYGFYGLLVVFLIIYRKKIFSAAVRVFTKK